MIDTPDTRSADMQVMLPKWKKVAAILGGTDAMREAGEVYLPKFASEPREAYEVRRKNARFTNLFSDVVENLAQRPFSDVVTLEDGADAQLVTFCEDVDGRGNNLHVFAGGLFHDAIASGVDWLLIDHPNAPADRVRTVADERARGIRPVWCRYAATDMLAVHSERLGGVEHIVHARMAETATTREGFKEVTKPRVRVLNRDVIRDDTGAVTAIGSATWAIWEKRKTDSGKEEWRETAGGPLTIGVIPLVPVLMGRRLSGWRIKPPMQDVADLQVEYFQQENGIKNAKNLTAFPMLSGDGVTPDVGDDGAPVPLVVGPATVLYAPDGGSWKYVEPQATALTFLKDDLAALAQEIRELGRQPLTAQSGNLTVITTAFAAQKGNSAVQAWALALKDALEQALVFTGLWMGIEGGATVKINTEFDHGIGAEDTFTHVLAMHEAGIIGADVVTHESNRRGITDPEYDGLTRRPDDEDE
ncbi:DUF4055 domain-containing protein [Ponticoccus litoralis]|uniref:DUF4055 domain-containing protein n=1 Tax=Ponticoccus litoralis TaxID=422297 RepID=A0AAW9S7S4_9RHOB